MTAELDHRELYRLPWNLADNAIAWLEPTAKCNLACEGCYRANINQHKSLDEVAADLDVFHANRKIDGVSIAGGEPLTHPQILDIVRMVKTRGWKPIINTNGLALTRELLVKLKQAGLEGLTFHVDSKQHRPGWKDKSEQEHNQLRLNFARMVADVGGLSCAFNATIYDDTLNDIPGLMEWAREHIDIVHVMVFILYRTSDTPEFDYYVAGQKVDMSPLKYDDASDARRSDISAPEAVRKIREFYPEFSPSAYLNGTEKADSFKWLLTGRLGTRKRIYGYVGSKFMEMAQTFHHLQHGRYLAYSHPQVHRRGRLMVLLLWPFDSGLRKVLVRSLMGLKLLASRLHLQSIMIIQPVDMLEDGRQNMCDGCPDMTVWKGGLAWSCRLEECMHFGGFVQCVPRNENVAAKPGV